jgi:methylaspartate ammonia-lyase
MAEIVRLYAVPGAGGYYAEDLDALQAEPMPVEARYRAPPVTPGFDHVRQVAQVVSVGIALDDGRVAWGDCCGVAYSGKAGRRPVFRAAEGVETLEQVVAPALIGRRLTDFRSLAAEIDALSEVVTVTRLLPEGDEPDSEPVVRPGMTRRDFLTAPFRFVESVSQEVGTGEEPLTEEVEEERLIHPAIRYGVSQAVLGAVALMRGVTMAEAIADEWDLARPDSPVPLHAQSGGERYRNAEKMIVRRVASLPHALVDNIPEQLGADGNELTRYVRWLVKRIQELGGPEYRPTIHLDVHGALGKVLDNQPGRILGQLRALELAAQPYRLRIECPVMMENRQEQIEMMRKLVSYVRFRKMTVQLVADEWANTLEDIQAFLDADAADMVQIKMPDLGSVHNSVEAVLACREAGTGAFLGGSCAETDLSARVSAHVALAVQPDIVMAKPGMGVDEAVSLMQNEMARTLSMIEARRSRGATEPPPGRSDG